MMAFPSQASNQKWCASLAKTKLNHPKIRSMSILYTVVILVTGSACLPIKAEEPPAGEEHAFEELGVNRYTAPSIAQIFKQLDDLKPLPSDQLRREPRQVAAPTREQKGLMFGELIADGFLLVEAEKKNLIDN